MSSQCVPAEGLSALLDNCGPEEQAAALAPKPKLLPIEDFVPPQTLASNSGCLSVSDANEWRSDPTGSKWDKIRSVFMNAKGPQEVLLEAAAMDVREWLDWVCRMAPKKVEVQAEVSFKNMLEALGPIDREAYRYNGPAVDAEFKEVSA